MVVAVVVELKALMKKKTVSEIEKKTQNGNTRHEKNTIRRVLTLTTEERESEK